MMSRSKAMADMPEKLGTRARVPSPELAECRPFQEPEVSFGFFWPQIKSGTVANMGNQNPFPLNGQDDAIFPIAPTIGEQTDFPVNQPKTGFGSDRTSPRQLG